MELFHGVTDVPLERVGALRDRDPQSADPFHPGVVVKEFNFGTTDSSTGRENLMKRIHWRPFLRISRNTLRRRADVVQRSSFHNWNKCVRQLGVAASLILVWQRSNSLMTLQRPRSVRRFADTPS